jgi:hypothetical protein
VVRKKGKNEGLLTVEKNRGQSVGGGLGAMGEKKECGITLRERGQERDRGTWCHVKELFARARERDDVPSPRA